MSTEFAPIGQTQHGGSGENSFWPSFTDIMMVITMIFLMATSLLVVRNWQLVGELRESIAAEQVASQTIEITVQENATLEERLANAEQSNSILRLRALKKEEELRSAKSDILRQQSNINQLETQLVKLEESVESANNAARVAELEVERLAIEKQTLTRLLQNVEQQLARQTQQTEQTRSQLAEQTQQTQQTLSQLAEQKQQNQLSLAELVEAQSRIASLTESSATQQASISELTREKLLLDQEVEKYNLQLMTLKGDYEVVKSKYEELIKPARSAKGKYIAEVYYVKGESGDIIRYRQPGDAAFTNLSLTEVENRLDRLKAQKGEDLYVKIIIPENSGLTYNEAWTFMRNLLVKYDYYYQE